MHPEVQLAMAKEILSILHADGGENGMERQWRDQFTRLRGTDDRAWADLKFVEGGLGLGQGGGLFQWEPANLFDARLGIFQGHLGVVATITKP
jgi:hypothetical protein